MANEFCKSDDFSVRAYELKKGDRFSIAVSALDEIPPKLNFHIVNTGVDIVKIPIRIKLPLFNKWIQLPFIKKKVGYANFIYTGDQ